MEIGQAVLTGIMSFLGSGVSATVVSYILDARKERKEADKETYISIRNILDGRTLSYIDDPSYYDGVPYFVHTNLDKLLNQAKYTNNFEFHDKKIKARFNMLVESLCSYIIKANEYSTLEGYDAEDEAFTRITTVPDRERGNYRQKDMYISQAKEIDDLALSFRSKVSDFENFVISRLRISPSKLEKGSEPEP